MCIILSLGANVLLENLKAAIFYYDENSRTAQLLLNINIELRGPSKLISYSYIMCNIKSDVNCIFNDYTFPTDLIEIAKQAKFLPKVFQFCTPTDKFMRNLNYFCFLTNLFF